MEIKTAKLNSLANLLRREEYHSRENRINGKYWDVCWETFQETEKVLRALMGHWRYARADRKHGYEIDHFPEIERVASVYQYPPPEYRNNWYYIGPDIKFQICIREGELYGKDVVILSGFSLKHGYMNMGNSWSEPIRAGEFANPEYRPKDYQNYLNWR